MALLLWLFLVGLLVSSTNSQMAYNLVVYTNATYKSYPYTYTTLGTPPTTLLQAKVITLTYHNLSSDCWFSNSTNISLLEGKIALLKSLPAWFGCVNEDAARAPAFGRIFQKVGGLGVIMQASEMYFYGGILAFDGRVNIPFVVLQGPMFQDLMESEILTSDFPAISAYDAKLLHTLHISYLVARWVIACLFIVNILFFSFILYDDIKYERKENKMNLHGIYLRGTAFAACFVGLFYVAIDPFGFLGYKWLNSQFLQTFYAVLYTTVSLLLLQLWMVTTGSFTTKIVEAKWFKYLIHIIPTLEFVLAFLQGWIKGNVVLQKMYWMSFLVTYVLCGVGFIVFGTNIITILYQSGNVLQRSEPLARKIIIFILCYLACTYTATIIYSLNAVGSIFSLLVSFFVFGALTLVLIFTLFMPPVLNRRKVRTRKLLTLAIPATPTHSLQRAIIPQPKRRLTVSIELESITQV